MIKKVLIQSGVNTTTGVTSKAITDFFRLGDFQFVRPSILWNKGKTYAGADKGNNAIAGFQNDIIMIEYDSATNVISTIDVGDGAGYNDIYNHPACWVWVENDYIYCGQSEPHNVGTSVYKSNSTNTINSGFTKLSNVEDDYSYPKALITHDGNFAFNFRLEGSLEYDDVGIVKSNSSSIEGTFTATQITDSLTSGYRYYNSTPVVYGTPTKTYFTPTIRRDTGAVYFAHVVLVTTDFNTFSNYQGTASKNVVSAAKFTDAEIEADYIINGSMASDGDELRVMNTMAVDDVLYGTYIKSGTSDWYIFKIDGTTKTEVNLSSNISNLRTDNSLNNFMYWNGSNIVLSVLTDDGTKNKELWAINSGLTTFTQKYTYNDALAYNDPIKLPENYDEVTGNYIFYVDSQLGVTDYCVLELTNDKYNL